MEGKEELCAALSARTDALAAAMDAVNMSSSRAPPDPPSCAPLTATAADAAEGMKTDALRSAVNEPLGSRRDAAAKTTAGVQDCSGSGSGSHDLPGGGGNNSDSSDEGGGAAAAAAAIAACDALYDADADDEDAQWVDRHMRVGGGRSGLLLTPTTTATLSCPACFGAVCLDCTKHGKSGNSSNYWSATVAVDCTVLSKRLLPSAATVRALPPVIVRTAGKTEYRQVQCGYCATEVGVYEVAEEAYLFYNVIPTLQS